MALPKVREARLYYRAAKQRWQDADILLQAGRRTGAVYLAGYAVECYLKALLLTVTAAGERRQTLESFRGQRGHNLAWLRDSYVALTGTSLPPAVRQHLALLSAWSTDLRYETGTLQAVETREFFEAVRATSAWADGRM